MRTFIPTALSLLIACSAEDDVMQQQLLELQELVAEQAEDIAALSAATDAAFGALEEELAAPDDDEGCRPLPDGEWQVFDMGHGDWLVFGACAAQAVARSLGNEGPPYAMRPEFDIALAPATVERDTWVLRGQDSENWFVDLLDDDGARLGCIPADCASPILGW